MIVCFPDCDVINFENNLSFLIKPFFYITKKVRTKKRQFVRVSLNQIKQFFLEGESVYNLTKEEY